MAKVRRFAAELIGGIEGRASGETLPIRFCRNGVITSVGNGPAVKRPGQYVPSYKVKST